MKRISIVDGVMLICAIMLTSIAAYRQFGPRAPETPPRKANRQIASWDAVRSGGHAIGPDRAAVTIVEFSDFQCPFCARFALSTLPQLRGMFPDDIRLVYRHWPLTNHPLSYPAALASECAAEQGRFWEYHDAVFRSQSTLDSARLISLAGDAGLSDRKKFRQCVASGRHRRAVDADSTEARAIKSLGTPTFIVNGWLINAPLDSARVDSIVRAARGARD
jgi:protein-disulfide isomerase